MHGGQAIPAFDFYLAPYVRNSFIEEVKNLEELNEKGVWIYGTDMGGTPYDETDFHGAVALVLGSEGSGMSRLVRETCDFTVSIPMCGHIDSMNVSAAGAVVMAEVARQRRG